MFKKPDVGRNQDSPSWFTKNIIKKPQQWRTTNLLLPLNTPDLLSSCHPRSFHKSRISRKTYIPIIIGAAKADAARRPSGCLSKGGNRNEVEIRSKSRWIHRTELPPSTEIFCISKDEAHISKMPSSFQQEIDHKEMQRYCCGSKLETASEQTEKRTKGTDRRELHEILGSLSLYWNTEQVKARILNRAKKRDLLKLSQTCLYQWLEVPINGVVMRSLLAKGRKVGWGIALWELHWLLGR